MILDLFTICFVLKGIFFGLNLNIYDCEIDGLLIRVVVVVLFLTVKEIKAPNLFERGKEEIEAIIQTEKKKRDSYGNGIEINEDTPISQVKAPNMFERAKEEIEALVGTIHPTREEEDDKSKPNLEQGSSSGGGGGFWSFLGSFLEKSCSPLTWTKK